MGRRPRSTEQRSDRTGTRSTLPGFLAPGQHWICALAGLLWAAGCVRQLPPAAVPAPVAPPVASAGTLEAGHGRLVVYVADGPAPVYRVRMEAEPVDRGEGRVSFQFHEEPTELCPAAPCIADLPAGNLLLGFPVIGRGGLEIELVHVDPETTVYRRALSRYTPRRGAGYVLGIIFTSVGSASAVTGMSLLPIGLSRGNDSLTTAGAITLGGGLVVTAIAIWAIRHYAPTYRPGSSIHFSPGSPASGGP